MEWFVGRLELNGMKRRLTWEATPRSVHDGVASAVASSDCLVFDANVARLFADASGNLSINVTVTICWSCRDELHNCIWIVKLLSLQWPPRNFNAFEDFTDTGMHGWKIPTLGFILWFYCSRLWLFYHMFRT